MYRNPFAELATICGMSGVRKLAGVAVPERMPTKPRSPSSPVVLRLTTVVDGPNVNPPSVDLALTMLAEVPSVRYHAMFTLWSGEIASVGAVAKLLPEFENSEIGGPKVRPPSVDRVNCRAFGVLLPLVEN